MIITDTHTHLYSEHFNDDRDIMIERAMSLGVQRFFIPAIDSTYTTRMIEFSKNYPDHMFLMTGLHPTHVTEDYESELQHVEDNLSKHVFYAIGEIGIDLYWETNTL